VPLYWRCRPHFSQQAHIDVTFIRDLRTWVRSINNFRVSNFPEISRWMLTSCWSVSYLTVHTKQCLRRRYFFCLSASRITQNFHECLTTSIIGRGTSNRRLDVGSDLDPDPGIFLHWRQWSSTEVAPYRHSLVGITSPSRLQEIYMLSECCLYSYHCKVCLFRYTLSKLQTEVAIHHLFVTQKQHMKYIKHTKIKLHCGAKIAPFLSRVSTLTLTHSLLRLTSWGS